MQEHVLGAWFPRAAGLGAWEHMAEPWETAWQKAIMEQFDTGCAQTWTWKIIWFKYVLMLGALWWEINASGNEKWWSGECEMLAGAGRGCVLALLSETLPCFSMPVCCRILGCFNLGADPCSAESWPGMELEMLWKPLAPVSTGELVLSPGSPVPSWHCPHSLGFSFSLISAHPENLSCFSLPSHGDCWGVPQAPCPVPYPQDCTCTLRWRAWCLQGCPCSIFTPKTPENYFLPTAKKEIFLLHIYSEIWPGWTRALNPSQDLCANPLPAAGSAGSAGSPGQPPQTLVSPHRPEPKHSFVTATAHSPAVLGALPTSGGKGVKNEENWEQ